MTDLLKYSNMISKSAKNILISLMLIVRHKSGNSSNIWLERQQKDPYVKRAIKESYRARSAFKLIEINEKYKFIRPGDVVIDVGAAPGSWTQVAINKTNSNGIDPKLPKGTVISVDREDIVSLEGAHLLSLCDINDANTINKISNILNGRKANSIISDMAPNSTGQSTFDHDAIIVLQRKAFDLGKQFLTDKGYFLCKIWFGDSTNKFTKDLSKNFEFVKLVKPKSSRSESAEIFIFCSNFKK